MFAWTFRVHKTAYRFYLTYEGLVEKTGERTRQTIRCFLLLSRNHPSVEFKALLYPFCTHLQRQTHLFEASLRISIKAGPKYRNQDSAESLALLELHLSGSDGLDHEAVLAIKYTVKQKATKPPKFPAGIGRQNGGTKSHTFSAAWLDSHLKPRALLRNAVDESDKGIPLRKGREIGENFPDALRPRINFNFRM